MSSLTSHYYLWVVLFVSFCVSWFCSKDVMTQVRFCIHFLTIPWIQISYKCSYDLYPKTYQFILVRPSCWMMWDASMPSFQRSRPIDFNSLSGTEIIDLYSTLGPTVLSGRLFLAVDSGITLLFSDRQILQAAQLQQIYSSLLRMYYWYLNAHYHYWWVVPHWLMVYINDR